MKMPHTGISLQAGILVFLIFAIFSLFQTWKRLHSVSDVVVLVLSLAGAGILMVMVWLAGKRVAAMSSIRQVLALLFGLTGLLMLSLVVGIILGEDSLVYDLLGRAPLGVLFFSVGIFGAKFKDPS